MTNYESLLTIPKTKKEEDEILLNLSEEFNINCKKNPGSLGELMVQKKLESFGLKLEKSPKIKCDWLYDQKHIYGDFKYKDTIIEVKTLRYFNCNGGRGNQGTGCEKIINTIPKYGNIYDYYKLKTLVVMVLDMEKNRYGKLLTDASKKKFNNNKFLEFIYPFLENNHIKFVNYSELDKEMFI
jgi:hypothetical protein